MNRIRLLAAGIAIGAAALLSGCVVPGPYYGGGAYPYYSGGAYPYYYGYGYPAVSTSVVIGGGYYGWPGWYGHGWNGGYYGHPGYWGGHGWYGRPGTFGGAGFGHGGFAGAGGMGGGRFR
jgi:hypothetical protein